LRRNATKTTIAAISDEGFTCLNLSEEKARTCVQYFTEVKGFLLAGIDSSLVNLEVVSDDLTTQSSSGSALRVMAKTDLSNEGSILFDERLVRLESNFNLFILLIHEFLHKSEHRGGFVSDWQSVGAYKYSATMFNDIGYALAVYAVERGYLSEITGAEDRFICSFTREDEDNEHYNMITGRRLCEGSDSASDCYVSESGKDKYYPPLHLSTIQESMKVSLRVEQRGMCDTIEGSSSTKIIVEDTRQGVKQVHLFKYNPMCEETRILNVNHGEWQLSCTFVGTTLLDRLMVRV
jgi:hypothetical protein